MTRERTSILVICVMFILTAVGWSLLIPIGEAPDENAHVRYAEFIRDHGALPDLAAIQRENLVEAWHPPLYHSLIALAMSVTGYSSRNVHFAVNPDFGDDSKPEHFNGSLNSEVRRLTPFGTLAAFHLLRIPNALFGALAIWFLWSALLLAAIPRNVALAMVGLWAASPGATFMSGVVGNDMLTSCLAAIFFYLFVRSEKEESLRWLVFASVVLGLGILTKATMVFLWGLMLIYIVLQRERRQLLSRLGFLVAIPALMTFWSVYRSWDLKPLIVDPVRVSQITGLISVIQSWGISLAKVIYTGFFSSIGLVGLAIIPLPGWYYGIYAGFMLIAVYAVFVRVRGEGRLQLPWVYVPGVAATLMVCALCVNWYRFSGEAIHARFFYPFLFGWLGLSGWGIGNRGGLGIASHAKPQSGWTMAAVAGLGVSAAIPASVWHAIVAGVVEWAHFSRSVDHYVSVVRSSLVMLAIAVLMLAGWKRLGAARIESLLSTPQRVLCLIIPLFAVNWFYLVFYVLPHFS
jgi:hypothetical protein